MNRQVSLAQVTSKGFLRISGNTTLRGIVLVLKRSDRPLQLYRPQTLKLKRPSPEGNYDRMAIIGQWNCKDCFVVISQSAQKSANLFSDRYLTVGSIVDVVEPLYTNTCLGNDMHNPIVETHHPLTVVNNLNDNDFPPIPISTSPTTPAMFHYTLTNRPLTFLHSIVVAPTCSGTLCDRRSTKNESVCACIQKSSVSSWTLSTRIISRDVDDEDDDPLSGDMTQSHHVASFFCTNDVLRLPSSSVDVSELREAIDRVSQHVNANGGWRVSGFVKSSVSDESITQEVQRIRVCRLISAVQVPDNMKYGIGEAEQPRGGPPPLQHANPNVLNVQH